MTEGNVHDAFTDPELRYRMTLCGPAREPPRKETFEAEPR